MKTVNCNAPVLKDACHESMNDKLSKYWTHFNGKDTKKAMKLLSKQYRILELAHAQGQSFETGSQIRLVLTGVYIIRYQSFEYPNEEFIWLLQPKEIL